LFGPGGFAAYVAAHPGVDPDGIIAFAEKQRARGPYTINIDSRPFINARNLIVSNVTTIDVRSDTQIRNIFGYTNLESRTGGDFDGSPYTVDQRGELGADSKIRQVSNELQIIGKTLDSGLDYVAGLYFSDEKSTERTLSVIFDILP